MPTRLRRESVLWGPPLAWAALIFFLSSQSDTSLAPPAPDWLLHGAFFAVLGALCVRAFAGSARRRPSPGAILAGIGAAAAYGALDEVHQMFVPGRTPELRDALADATGASLGALGGILLAIWLAPRTARTAVVLYTKKDCGLCGPALRTLRRAARAHPVDLRIVDVADDPEAMRLYGAEVPVVTIDGRKAFKFQLDPAALDRRLAGARRAPGAGERRDGVPSRGAA